MVRTLFFLILVTGFHDRKTDPVTGPSTTIRYGDHAISSRRIIKTSSGLFRCMNFELIQSSKSKREFFEGAVLPLKTKIRIFGDNPALGKTITVDSCQLEVIGIIRDVPEKSCLCCDLVILRTEPEMPVEALINLRCLIIK